MNKTSSHALVLAIALAAAAHCNAQPPAAAAASDTASAHAPDMASDTPIQTVEVRGVRDPALMPYEKAYDFLTRLRKIGDGRVDMAIRVLSARTLQPVPGLEIFLKGEKTHRPLALSPEGFLTMVLDPAYLQDKAAILTNKPKGSIVVEYYFVPTLPADALRYGDIAASIAAGKRAFREAIPWYVRPFVGTVSQVMLCYPDKDRQVAISHGDTVIRPASSGQKNVLSKTNVHCAVFTEDETRKAPETLVTASPGYTALFR